ncbi:MAG TPA: hypothetical protein VK133_02420 [Amoebophilaceae bacterium]|jgi:hypothetical protein|nr:hypothetical protein [Amoebophilaceae bacterium]
MHQSIRIKFVCIFIVSTLLHNAVLCAHAEENDLPFVQQEAYGPSKTDPSDADAATDASPIPPGAPKQVLDLFAHTLVPKPIHVPIYVPVLQHMGIRLDWFRLLRSFAQRKYHRYEGGIDFHFRKDIQLSFNIGHACDRPDQKQYGNSCAYQSAGPYGLVALRYVQVLNPRTYAYIGIAYGMSRFRLNILPKSTPTSLPPYDTASYLGVVFGSECKLFSRGALYGGMAFRVMQRLHGPTSNIQKVSNYTIPGYGWVANKLNCTIIPYLKWDISFLEKRISS